MKKLNDNILYAVIAVLVGLIIHMYLSDDSEGLNEEMARYKREMVALEEQIVVQEKKTDKERADILVLTDDESVQLLSKNIKGI